MSGEVLADVDSISHDSQTVRVRLKDCVEMGHLVRQREPDSDLEDKEVRCRWRFSAQT